MCGFTYNTAITNMMIKTIVSLLRGEWRESPEGKEKSMNKESGKLFWEMEWLSGIFRQ